MGERALIHRRAEGLAIRVLQMDAPESKNALSTEMLESLATELEVAQSDDRIRVVVLTGGPRWFASGADIRQLRTARPAAYLVSHRREAWDRVSRFPKPLIAAVNGYALGGGCELALSCDLVVAADDAVLGQPEIRLGLFTGAGGAQRWTRIIGRYRAADILLLGKQLSAWHAYHLGVASKIVPPQRVLPAAVEIARTLSEFSPLPTRLGKSVIRAADEMPLAAGLEYERSVMAALLSTDDHLEGIDAFLERRRPQFGGS